MEDRLSNPNRFCFSVICGNVVKDAQQSFWPRLLSLVAVLIVTCGLATSSAIAAEPDWIWTPKTNIAKRSKDPSECFFRKKFTPVSYTHLTLPTKA